jgi:hypothetical protein
VTFAATATRMTAKYGRTYVLKRVAKGAYDPATGTAAETVTEEEVVGIPIRPGVTQMAGTVIERRRASVFLPATQPTGETLEEPGTDDRIVDGEREFEIAAVDPIDIQAGAIAYICELG